jgi:hypothetical protein
MKVSNSTDDFFHLDWSAWVRERSRSNLVFSGNFELIDSVFGKFYELVFGLRYLLFGRLHPLNLVFLAALDYVIGDLGASIILWWSPMQDKCGILDIGKRRSTRFSRQA